MRLYFSLLRFLFHQPLNLRGRTLTALLCFQVDLLPVWKTVPSPPNGGLAQPDSASTQQALGDFPHLSEPYMHTALLGQVNRLSGEVSASPWVGCALGLDPGQAP